MKNYNNNTEYQPSVVAHTLNSSTGEAEAHGSLRGQGQPKLHSETLSQNSSNNNKKALKPSEHFCLQGPYILRCTMVDIENKVALDLHKTLMSKVISFLLSNTRNF